MDNLPLLDHSKAQGLLWPGGQFSPFQEDERRSWLAHPSLFSEGQQPNPFLKSSSIYIELQTKPLLRLWDTYSGSIPDRFSGNRMIARLPRGELATSEARQTSLALHADHKNREPTPYISFTSSPPAIVELANRRLNEGKRGDQNLVVIDAGYRLKKGLCVLDMAKEASYYDVKNPYRHDHFTDHYLCLWEVTPAEVVGTCSWDSLVEDDNWYENIVMPAFERHIKYGTAQGNAA